MAKKVTMMDIAREANVSQTTVSLVLNGSNAVQISEETRDKVYLAAAELGYKKSETVLKRIESKKIALVLDSVSDNDPFIDAINTIWSAGWENDYFVSTFYSGNNPVLEKQIQTEISCNNSYVGIIYASSKTRKDIELKIKTNLPVVLLNCTSIDSSIPSIMPADLHGGYKATEHLIKKGYKNIAVVLGETWMEATQQRLMGYEQALIDNQLIPKKEYQVEADWSLKSAYQQTKKLLGLASRPDAIFCFSDYMAMGCYQAIKEHDLKIGEDIAVMGYDNTPLGLELEPKLSSVELPYSKMGEEALMRVDLLIQQQPLLQNLINFSSELYVRESTTVNER
ncbi:LacI family DNA-binding transcriptional regulator [Photobacterium gaetbulicola]|uniref:Transcriptional regulator, periplasmic binding protein of LacI family protein n=1 Tax=Photobacterium gaetbulicola Gung47 TaxID=658445 RepID=A0A0C5WGJ4_9GAMM|nr:LacI family DNA-binding transcriptional regulator [Photobacterium gaetbulicola]AJR05317.1 transcriptional regulator, periplasmic binding protein of LacI family protein [Photobacterium gaetbulicola Gung47]PSU12644.1 LacI family DNA-binding transcriptional regulator [Photobacterium gaetbulicola]